MEKEENKTLKEYFECLYNLQNGNAEPMQRFKLSYPYEYAVINGCYHKRVKLGKILDFMQSVGKVYCGCLTFNEEEDSKSVSTKRRQCWRHLNSIFKVVVMVEELGSLHDRYHVHFMGVFRDGKTMEDFFKWHSREDISPVRSKKRVKRYLCDYMSKQVPRIRQNKALIQGMKHYNKAQSWKNYKFSSLAVEEERVSLEVVDLISALS